MKLNTTCRWSLNGVFPALLTKRSRAHLSQRVLVHSRCQLYGRSEMTNKSDNQRKCKGMLEYLAQDVDATDGREPHERMVSIPLH